MRVTFAQAQQQQYAVAPRHPMQPQIQPGQWYARPGPQVGHQAVAHQVVRQRRATVATEVHHRQVALLAEHREREQPRQPVRRPQQQQQMVQQQRNPPQPRQNLQRHQLQQHVQQDEQPVAVGFNTRIPAPLPSVWRVDYEVGPDNPALGGGAFAEVFKVYHRQTGQPFAVKVMHRPNFTLRGIERQIESEIEAMRLAAELSRDQDQEELYIVRLFDVAEDGEYVYLLLELCEQGDLLRKLHMEPTKRIGEELAAVWAKQLLMGLRTVHSLGYIHRDIKPDNLLCTESGTLKIADFGWCCIATEAPTSLAGTFVYMAPEVLSNVPQTVQSDVWSAGVTLYEMLVGKSLLTTYLGPGATKLSECDPHRATAIKQQWLVNEINTTCPPSIDFKPLDISPACWDFLQKLLVPDPRERITVDAALQHPWLMSAADLAAEEQKVEEATIVVVEPPELSPNEADQCFNIKAHDNSLNSPAFSKRKDAWSPSRGSASKDSISNVPTPSKPRSYDPTRNMAYTPPVSPEMTPERTQWPKEENSGAPEVSPERRSRLQLSSDRLSSHWGSPKDTLLDKMVSSRLPLAKLPSPQRSSPQTHGGPSNRRKTIASQMPATGDSQEYGIGEQPKTYREQDHDQKGGDPEVAQILLSKLQCCDEGLREAREFYTARGGEQQ
ncbi:unnamed protein product, partial [Polarella glacialis]